MTQQHLSDLGKVTLESFLRCQPDEQRALIAHFSQELVCEIAKSASAASASQLAEALAIVQRACLRGEIRPGILSEINFCGLPAVDFYGVPAVEGRILVDGQELDTVLPTVSCGLSKDNLKSSIRSGDYRFATTKESLEYIGRIIKKNQSGLINEAESKALRTYCELPVRSDRGGVVVKDLAPRIDWIDDSERNATVLLVKNLPARSDPGGVVVEGGRPRFGWVVEVKGERS